MLHLGLHAGVHPRSPRGYALSRKVALANTEFSHLSAPRYKRSYAVCTPTCMCDCSLVGLFPTVHCARKAVGVMHVYMKHETLSTPSADGSTLRIHLWPRQMHTEYSLCKRQRELIRNKAHDVDVRPRTIITLSELHCTEEPSSNASSTGFRIR